MFMKMLVNMADYILIIAIHLEKLEVFYVQNVINY